MIAYTSTVVLETSAADDRIHTRVVSTEERMERMNKLCESAQV